MAAKDPSTSPSRSDEDLLADAIPIEEVEDMEEIDLSQANLQPPSSLTTGAPAAPAEPAVPDAPKPIELDENAQVEHREIRTFDTHKVTDIADTWKRKPKGPPHGGAHCRTFIAKLRQDAIEHLDHQVNEWLDQHPEFEVKHSAMTTGILSGKLREEALFFTIWV